ncbi:MAG: hypothetical protein A2V70_12935 [Planctomycetes bacterium RBG_13_63_9]|nr:MAG: hypothetical protein A2V70_12935 [Planctomycetes bacterium RBG_13_63_9]
MVPNHVLVGLRTETRLMDVGPLVETLDWPAALGSVTKENVGRVYSIPRSDDDFLTVVNVSLPEEIGVLEAVAQLSELEFVEFAEPDYLCTDGGFQSVPSDPFIGYHGQYFHETMDNYTAWEITDGTSDSVLVAVLDSGRTGLYRFTAISGGGYDVAELGPAEGTIDVFYNGDQPETIDDAQMYDDPENPEEPDGLVYHWKVEDFTQIDAEYGAGILSNENRYIQL